MDGRYPPKRSCRPWMHANKHHMAYWHDFLGRASSLRSMKHLYVLRYRCLEVRGLWRPVVQGLNRRGQSAKSFVRQKCGGFSVIVCKTHNEGRFICTKFSSARRNWRARGCIFAHFFVRVGKKDLEKRKGIVTLLLIVKEIYYLIWRARSASYGQTHD